MNTVSVIIVTHNSEPVVDRCISAVLAQKDLLLSLVVVDSGSADSSYLNRYESNANIQLVRTGNIGFAKGNNLGYQQLSSDISYVVFLNPDAFLCSDTLHIAINRMSQMDDIGCLTGKLLGYDPETEQANGFFDSTGIFRKWYGRWYDRGLGKVDTGQYDHSQFLPAACGAFMVCRKKAIDKILVNNQDVFDPDFFLYKEDIEFSLRLRKNGYKIFYDPEVEVYHCRGWNQKRSQVSYRNRLMSAENELLLYRKHVSLYYIWALFKYLLVRVFRV